MSQLPLIVISCTSEAMRSACSLGGSGEKRVQYAWSPRKQRSFR